MLGSKIKSWVENHLGRPRKKSNKNKNVPPADNLTNGEQYNQKHAASGFTIYSTNSCSSPLKTVTTTNNSSLNHVGYSSGVISSPSRRREVSPIQNHTQSRYGWQSPEREQVMSPKSETFLYALQHRSQQYLRNHHTAPNTRENSCEDNKIILKQLQQHQLNCSTSSFSSLSWSTGSKEPSMQSNNIPNSNNICVSVSAAGSTFKSDIKSLAPLDLKETNEDPNVVHYEEIDEIGTLIRHPEKLLGNVIGTEYERPKSEQLPKYPETATTLLDNKNTQDDASTRYGRLLPSKMPNPIIVSFRTGSEECIPQNNSQIMSSKMRAESKHLLGAQSRTGMRNKLRTGMTQTPQQGNVIIPQVSLSSPESAYSTGYSTDGTSPGTGYTAPEYYVNMRTGTHYFPKSVNSLAIEAQRYKFGLNKIEEMSPIDPVPKTSFTHRNVEENYSALAIQTIFEAHHEKTASFQTWGRTNATRSPLSMRNPIIIPTLRGFESPSPRQRCRIRTNPWYSTTETSSSGSTVNASNLQQHSGGLLMNTSLTSSRTFSSASSHSTSALSTIHLDQDFGRCASSPDNRNSTSGVTVLSVNNKSNNMLKCVSSDSSSSLTEVEVENMQRCFTPNTARQKRSMLLHPHQQVDPYATCSKNSQEAPLAVISDDDATLNEMMGKFDESYIYEKETDILSSDSDPTDCQTDMDTGQDAGDECDTDDLLDIDFIDTSSIQEVCENRDNQMNLGKCYYVNGSPSVASRRASLKFQKHAFRSMKTSNEQAILTAAANSAQKRRKRFHKTRKKGSESREFCRSPMRKSRETRSVGGTPVCLRKRMHVREKQKFSYTTPHRLSHRSSSLVLAGARDNSFMTVAESEKALWKADFEADVKYRQLILEAESILTSMRNSLQSIARETPAGSPRRLNPLANKRVEMIKNCEIEPKKDLQKQQQQNSPKRHIISESTDHDLVAAINKRIEVLKLDTYSPPGSPKIGQCSPRKTHLTNFINQNTPSESNVRKLSNNSPISQRRCTSPVVLPSPLLQQQTKDIQSPKVRPNRSQNLQLIDFDSDQDSRKPAQFYSNIKYDDVTIKPNLMDQRRGQLALNYCPQSEPLKRKIYKNHTSSIGRNSQNGNPGKGDRHPSEDRSRVMKDGCRDKFKSNSLDLYQLPSPNVAPVDINTTLASEKTALILNTIADLKKNLEHQSIELNGFHES